MASKVSLKISSDEFKYSSYDSLKMKCKQMIPGYSECISKTIDNIRFINPLASEKKNFILRIYSEDTDIELVYFRVKGGFRKLTRTEHEVRNGVYSLSQPGKLQRIARVAVNIVKSISVSVTNRGRQIAQSKTSQLLNSAYSKVKGFTREILSHTITKSITSFIGDLAIQGLLFISSSALGLSFPPWLILGAKYAFDFARTTYQVSKFIYSKAKEKYNEIKEIYSVFSEESNKTHKLPRDCRIVDQNENSYKAPIKIINEYYLPNYTCVDCKGSRFNYLTQYNCCKPFYCNNSCHEKNCLIKGQNKMMMACFKCHLISEWHHKWCPKCNLETCGLVKL